MAYVTIEKNAMPWMLCHSTHDGEIERQVGLAKNNEPTADFTYRPSTPEERQRCEKAMDAQDGLVEDPFKFFTIKI